MAYTHRGKRKTTSKRKNIPYFDPMVYALDRIKAHFDKRAHFTHDECGNRVIAYALISGKRIILGGTFNSNLVYNREIVHFTEQQAKVMAHELGMW